MTLKYIRLQFARDDLLMVYRDGSTVAIPKEAIQLQQRQTQLAVRPEIVKNPESTETFDNVVLNITSIEPYPITNKVSKGKNELRDSKEFVTPGHAKHGRSLAVESKESVNCSTEEKDKPLICSIKLTPDGHWKKLFDVSTLYYEISYPDDVIYVSIEAEACYCGKKVSIGSKDGPVSMATWALNVGQNVIPLFLVDNSHSKQWVYSKYGLVILRSVTIKEPKEFIETKDYRLCKLHQDCDMVLDDSHPCGLIDTGSQVTWKELIKQHGQLKYCDSGSSSREFWLMPCSHCHLKDSCFWSKAIWASDQCAYITQLNQKHIRLLTGKTYLFFGDSSLRGIMYYMIEKINNTLYEWELVHSHVVYANIDGQGTNFAFYYYPQSWLPLSERNNSIDSLLSVFSNLQNNKNTILIVGGVQWINSKIMADIRESLQSAGLSEIQVVIKSYSSGFNVPAAGILFHNLEEQKRMAKRNTEIIKLATSNNFIVLDTFWMTISRFKHALYGKCACNFHKVLPQRNGTYHVTGRINELYSNRLIQYLVFTE